MRITTAKLSSILLLFFLFCLISTDNLRHVHANGTIPLAKPLLINADFECDVGYYEVESPDRKPNRIPASWISVLVNGWPRLNSTRIQYGKDCAAEDVHVERINGRDSFVMRAWDLEKPPEPGKPFDVTIYQQTPAEPGGAYSVSGWFLTLCGGSAVPNDCPEEYYMAKMLGLDPTGGIDPEAESVVWIENRNNFVDENDQRIGWSNLYTTAIAKADTLTVFARINSPLQWHGNHGFVDAISLVRAPIAEFNGLPPIVIGLTRSIDWIATQSPDVEEIAGGNYDLLVDIEYRHTSQDNWQPLVTATGNRGSVNFVARCVGTDYHFRVRARAEQPDNEEGAWPNQRFPGPWSDEATIRFELESGEFSPSLLPNSIFLPLVETGGC